MKNFLKRVPIVLSVFTPLLAYWSWFYGRDFDAMTAIWIVTCAVTVILFGANIFTLIISYKSEDSSKKFAFWCMLTKLLALPIHIANLVVAVIIMLGAMMALIIMPLLAGGFNGKLVLYLLTLLIMAYSPTLTSAIYGIFGRVASKRELDKPYSVAGSIFFGIFALIPFADAIAGIVFFSGLSKRLKLQGVATSRVSSQQVNVPPTYDQQAYNQQMYMPPVFSQPVYNQQSYVQQVNVQPVYNQQAYNQQMRNIPVYGQQPYNQQVNNPPVNNQQNNNQ